MTIPEQYEHHTKAVNDAAIAVDAARAAKDASAEAAAVRALEAASAARRAFLRDVWVPATSGDLPGDTRSLRHPRGF